MQLTVKDIEKEIAGDTLVPGRLAHFRTYLAGMYSFHASEMQSILATKPAVWNAIRATKDSDKATEREWQATEKGLRETWLKWEMKRIEKLIAAIASQLRVLEGEAKNLH